MRNNLKFLLDYCSDKAELYNKVSNLLWVEFGIKSAEVCLICTFVADRMRKENKNDNRRFKLSGQN